MNGIVNNGILFTEMKVIANKQNTAMMGVEEPADLAKVFVIFKQQNKTNTTTDVDPCQHFTKPRVTKAFNNEDLKMYSNNNVALTLDNWHDNGGMLMINNDDINHIKSITKRQHCHLLKHHTYRSYLFELDCDAAIQVNMNVSSNPGLESLSLECLVDCCVFVFSFYVLGGWSVLVPFALSQFMGSVA